MRIFKAGALLLALITCCLSFASASESPASALKQFSYLTGVYRCTTTDGHPYVEHFSRPVGGAWLRATDVQNGKVTGDHTLGYDPRANAWYVFSAGSNGGSSLMKAAGSNATVMRTVYPSSENMTLTFVKHSATSYSLHFGGTMDGKPVHEVDNCTQ
jgi:hypothetical protein